MRLRKLTHNGEWIKSSTAVDTAISKARADTRPIGKTRRPPIVQRAELVPGGTLIEVSWSDFGGIFMARLESKCQIAGNFYWG
jgi:hypothetical protein